MTAVVGRAGPVVSGGEAGMWQRRMAGIALGVALTGCAASSTPSTRPSLSTAGRDVLTAAEIVAARVTDAYQAVSQLRPEFLKRRSAVAVPAFTPVSVAVYLDDQPFGNTESLHMIPLDRVRIIRYMPRTEAEIRFGKSFPAGVIQVTTLKK
jgi:hypothetical protein